MRVVILCIEYNYYVLNCVLCGCQLCNKAVQCDMGWCCSMAGSSPEYGFGKVHITSMEGTIYIYLLVIKCHMVSTQTVPAAYMHDLWKDCIPVTTPRQPTTLITLGQDPYSEMQPKCLQEAI